MSSQRKYPDNSLDGFRNGACLDLRVRWAKDLLEHSPIFGRDSRPVSIFPDPSFAMGSAQLALDIATALLALAEERGLVGRLGTPEDEAALESHAKRNARFQTTGQIEAQKVMQEAQSGRIAVNKALNG